MLEHGHKCPQSGLTRPAGPDLVLSDFLIFRISKNEMFDGNGESGREGEQRTVDFPKIWYLIELIACGGGENGI